MVVGAAWKGHGHDDAGGPDGEFPARVRVVDARAWSGATADGVLAAVDDDAYLDPVFVAGRHTMRSPTGGCRP
ncbi:DUF6924 domain-containing protein [Streptomyces cinereoruber]|uniref:DUF6924 domain-containing protein n=1 Tax=Streptomyces cinereoruber TaxID=67260 RepID=UPI00363B889A